MITDNDCGCTVVGHNFKFNS